MQRFNRDDKIIAVELLLTFFYSAESGRFHKLLTAPPRIGAPREGAKLDKFWRFKMSLPSGEKFGETKAGVLCIGVLEKAVSGETDWKRIEFCSFRLYWLPTALIVPLPSRSALGS